MLCNTSQFFFCVFFFFQAEDGIRDYKVTGVQTCALPISAQRAAADHSRRRARVVDRRAGCGLPRDPSVPPRRVAEGGGEAVNRQERFVRIGGALIWIFAAFPVAMEWHTPRTRIAVWLVSY